MSSPEPEALACEVLAAYEAYVEDFHAITRRARERFENRDWTGAVQDSLARLRLYKHHLDPAVRRLTHTFGARAHDPAFWEEAKGLCRAGAESRYDADLALMFLDSVMRQALPPGTVPYGSQVVDVRLDPRVQAELCRSYQGTRADLADLIEQLLLDCGFRSPLRDRRGDALRSARAVEHALRPLPAAGTLVNIDGLRPVFYRNKGAYVVGRIRCGGQTAPLALALSHAPDGIIVDAALTDETDLRRIFSYTRSNFHVELEGQYREILQFLHEIMPHKNWAGLYSSIGFMNPAKIQLSKDLNSHLRRPHARLTAAWGIPGLVMAVFTSPGFPYVFKVIRDDDKVKKTGYIGRHGVVDKYRLVQEGDRVGRLLDTITFHHLRFRRDDFDPKVLGELLHTAGASVREVGGDIAITRCYAQREATPLPIHLRQCDWPEVERVLNDLGWCLKDIAAAGLFPGEFDLKNFGVAEDGRVVFFDFDGLDELRKFSFDDVPLEASLGQEELFEYLLHEYRVSLTDVFRRLHPELFTPTYWRRVQELLREGEVLDTFPYPAQRRFDHQRSLQLPSRVERELERLGLKSAHRRGHIVWENLGSGLAVGRSALSALSVEARREVHETFGVDAADAAPQRLGVIVIDGRPAFVCLPELSSRVVDLTTHYDGRLGAEWRARVQRALFFSRTVEFFSPA